MHMRDGVMRGVIFFCGLAVGLAILSYFVSREGWGEIGERLLSFGVVPFLGFVALSFVNFFFYTWRWYLILRRQSPHYPSLWRLYWHRMAGYATGYLTPLAQVGGEPARVALVVTDGVALRPAVSSATLDIAFELCAFVLFVLAGTTFAYVEGAGDSTVLTVMLVVLVLMLLLFGGFLYAIATGRQLVRRFFHVTGLERFAVLAKAESWGVATEELMASFFRGDRRLLAQMALLSLVTVMFRVVEVFYIAAFFGVGLTFAQAFLASTLPGLALILPIPGGLGLFEGGFAALFHVLAIPLDPVAFALIIRLRDLIFIGLGVTHMFRQGGTYVVKRMRVSDGIHKKV